MNVHADQWLLDFVAESNRIEGVFHVSEDDVKAHQALLDLSVVETPALESFVWTIAPGHRLRDRVGLDVRVGGHTALRGGPAVRKRLDSLLRNLGRLTPLDAHRAYENLHPFTDGNGRSGRALWLWQMLRSPGAGRAKSLGFLHTFYYQTLDAGDRA